MTVVMSEGHIANILSAEETIIIIIIIIILIIKCTYIYCL